MIVEDFPVLKYTVQLYYAPPKTVAPSHFDDSPPVQIASGVLIKNASKFFLLTCKHVFDNIRLEDVIILTSGGFGVRLPDQVKFINNENDSIDIALIRLQGERVKELKTCYSFLPSKYLGFKHTFDEDLWYMLFGFINKRTTLKSIAFHAESFAFLTTYQHYKKIEKLGFDYTNNITLVYNRRKQGEFGDDTPRFGFKDLRGLSGGGIWLSVAGKRRGTYNYLLMGILIEERIDRGFVVGTKIDLIEKSLL